MRRGIVTGVHWIDGYANSYPPERVNGMVVNVHRESTTAPGHYVAESLLPGYFFCAAKVHFIGEGGAS